MRENRAAARKANDGHARRLPGFLLPGAGALVMLAATAAESG